MYAVFKFAGFQYSVEEGSVIKVPHQDVESGGKFDIADVMMVKTSDTSLVGTPFVDGAKIQVEVVSHGKDDKIEIYKYKRRTKYRLRQGHRQDFTEIKIAKIVTP